MTKKRTRRSALALVASGAGLLTWGTGGFTKIDVAKQTDLDTTSDGAGSTALFGINPLDEAGPIDVAEGERRPLIEVTSNAGEDLDISSVKLTNSPGPTVTPTKPSGSIGTGDTATIGAKVERCDRNAGQQTVRLDIGAESATDSGFETTVTRTVDIDCQINDVEIVDGSARTGNRAYYEQDLVFDVTNTRPDHVTFTGVRVEQTNAGADRLDANGLDEAYVWITDQYDPNNRTHNYDGTAPSPPNIGTDPSDRIDLSPTDPENPVSLGPGNVASIELIGFEDSGGPISMGGTEVSDIKIGSGTNIGGTTVTVTLFYETASGIERSSTVSIDSVTGDLEYIRGSAETFDADGSNDLVAFNLLNNAESPNHGADGIGFSQLAVDATSSAAVRFAAAGTSDLLAAIDGTSADYSEDGGFDGFAIDEQISLPSAPDLAEGVDSRWNLSGFEDQDTGFFDDNDPVDMRGEELTITINRERSRSPGGGLRFNSDGL